MELHFVDMRPNHGCMAGMEMENAVRYQPAISANNASYFQNDYFIYKSNFMLWLHAKCDFQKNDTDSIFAKQYYSYQEQSAWQYSHKISFIVLSMPNEMPGGGRRWRTNGCHMALQHSLSFHGIFETRYPLCWNVCSLSTVSAMTNDSIRKKSYIWIKAIY